MLTIMLVILHFQAVFLSWSCCCREQLEFAKTYDELWNAAQREMLHLGKCHGMLTYVPVVV